MPFALNAMVSSAAAGGDKRFDFVVAGAGHNSLITAAYLAKAGFSVIVLEGQPQIGGGCKTADVSLPGFLMDLCSSVHLSIQSNPLIRDDELALFSHGLEYIYADPIIHMPFQDRSNIAVWKDENRTYAEYAKHSKKDAETFKRLLDEWKAYRQARAAGNPIPMANIWRRRLAMSAYELINELFENEHIRSFHLAVGRLRSDPIGDQGTGNWAFSVMTNQIVGRPMPVGGSGVLSETLGSVILENNGVVLTNMPVEQLIIENGKCAGVECSDGTRFHADKAVVSTVHLKHLVDMAPNSQWGDEFLTGVDLFQPEYAMFAFHYATSEAPEYPLEDDGTIVPAESVVMGSPEVILRGPLEQATGEFIIDGMPLQIVCPSVVDSTRAPEGHHTLKVIGNLPYDLKEGPQHWDVIKDEVADQVFDYFRQFSPNLTEDKILAKFIMSPIDIERSNPAMWRGSTHAGRSGAAQTGDMRPVPGWSNYRMPINGLYQTGGCTAPMGGIGGGSGRNAAKVILEDFGSSIEEIVAGKIPFKPLNA